MKVLVTGAAGFIGFWVAKALCERGDDVVGIDSLSDYYDPDLKKARLEVLKKFDTFSFKQVNITDEEKMQALCKENQFNKICHLAAQASVRYSIDHPFVYEQTNLKGFLVVLECARKNDIRDLVFASSSSVYGEESNFQESDKVDKPASLYAATKRSNELMAYTYHHLFGLNCTGLRFFTVYGPFGRPDMAYFKFTKKIIEGEEIEVYNEGKMERDFTYITDIVNGVVAAIDRPFPYEIINLGNNKPMPLLEFIKTIEEGVGKSAKKKMLGMQKGDVRRTAADISKAAKLLDYNPKTSIKEGIEQFVKWYKEFYNVS